MGSRSKLVLLVFVVICGIVMGFVLSSVLLSTMFGGAMMASMGLFR